MSDPANPAGGAAAMPRVVAFDIGETLIDETRLWSRWADRLGVTRLSFLGVLGAMAGTGRPLRDTFQLVSPGVDVPAEIERWAVDEPDGLRENFDADDLYDDVRSCFGRLAERGIEVVIAGNQPPQARRALEAMELGIDRILISDDIGVSKPHPGFFAEVAVLAGAEPAEIAYVGDRVDNDIVPARQAGMTAVLVRRGPWGHLHAAWPEAAEAHHIIDTLDELPDVLAAPRLDRSSS